MLSCSPAQKTEKLALSLPWILQEEERWWWWSVYALRVMQAEGRHQKVSWESSSLKLDSLSWIPASVAGQLGGPGDTPPPASLGSRYLFCEMGMVVTICQGSCKEGTGDARKAVQRELTPWSVVALRTLLGPRGGSVGPEVLDPGWVGGRHACSWRGLSGSRTGKV